MTQNSKDVFNSKKVCNVGLAILQHAFSSRSTAPLQNVSVIEEKQNLKPKSRKSGKTAEEQNENAEEIEGVAPAPPLESSAANALYRAMAMQAILPIPLPNTPASTSPGASPRTSPGASQGIPLSNTFSERQTMLESSENKENPGFLPRSFPKMPQKPNPQIVIPSSENIRKSNQPSLNLIEATRETHPRIQIKAPQIEGWKETDAISSLRVLAPLFKNPESIEKFSLPAEVMTDLPVGSKSAFAEKPVAAPSRSDRTATQNGVIIDQPKPINAPLLSESLQTNVQAMELKNGRVPITQALPTQVTLADMPTVQNGVRQKPMNAPSLSESSPTNLQAMELKNGRVPITQALPTQAALVDTPMIQNEIVVEHEKLGSVTNPNRPETHSLTAAPRQASNLSPLKIAEPRQSTENALLRKETGAAVSVSSDLKTSEKIASLSNANSSTSSIQTAPESTPLSTPHYSVLATPSSSPLTDHGASIAQSPTFTPPVEKVPIERVVSVLKQVALTISQEGAIPTIARLDSKMKSVQEPSPVINNLESVEKETAAAKPEFTTALYSQPVIIEDYWGVGRL